MIALDVSAAAAMVREGSTARCSRASAGAEKRSLPLRLFGLRRRRWRESSRGSARSMSAMWKFSRARLSAA